MSQKRSQARSHATQAIYQWQVTGENIDEIIAGFIEEQDVGKFDLGYFRGLIEGVTANLSELDKMLTPLLDRPIEQVDLVERAILRLGAYELAFQPEVPYRVVINESVELAKVYGADQGHKYINGVLDKLAGRVRQAEASVGKR